MAYEVVMPYHLHMPSYFLETFTEYPYLVLPRKYSSTVKGVLQYFQGSTPVLPRKYWNQGKL